MQQLFNFRAGLGHHLETQRTGIALQRVHGTVKGIRHEARSAGLAAGGDLLPDMGEISMRFGSEDFKQSGFELGQVPGLDDGRRRARRCRRRGDRRGRGSSRLRQGMRRRAQHFDIDAMRRSAGENIDHARKHLQHLLQ